MVPIPESLNGVTSQWLSAALSSSGHLDRGTVAVNDIEPIGAESGFASRVGRVHLRCDGSTRALPPSMIVKLTPVIDDRSWARLIEDKYARECFFYSRIAPDAGVRTPVCYFAAHDADPPRFVLLLEDLGAARFGDAAISWSRSDAEMVVDALAGLHARWWNHPTLEQWASIPRYGDVTAQLEKILTRRTIFLERYQAYLSAELQRMTAQIGPHSAERLRTLGGRPLTLLHTDAHLDNVAFMEDAAAEAVLFDWQTITRGQGVVDLAFFLMGGSPEQRRQHERSLIERYHSRLVARGVTDYAVETLTTDYRVALFRWWIGTVNGLGSDYAAAWTGRQARLALQSVRWWNAVAADHELWTLVE